MSTNTENRLYFKEWFDDLYDINYYDFECVVWSIIKQLKNKKIFKKYEDIYWIDDKIYGFIKNTNKKLNKNKVFKLICFLLLHACSLEINLNHINKIGKIIRSINLKKLVYEPYNLILEDNKMIYNIDLLSSIKMRIKLLNIINNFNHYYITNFKEINRNDIICSKKINMSQFKLREYKGYSNDDNSISPDGAYMIYGYKNKDYINNTIIKLDFLNNVGNRNIIKMLDHEFLFIAKLKKYSNKIIKNIFKDNRLIISRYIDDILVNEHFYLEVHREYTKNKIIEVIQNVYCKLYDKLKNDKNININLINKQRYYLNNIHNYTKIFYKLNKLLFRKLNIKNKFNLKHITALISSIINNILCYKYGSGYRHPIWSPDGNQFTVNGGDIVYKIEKRNKIYPITTFYKNGIDPSWSYDCNKVCGGKLINNNAYLYVYNTISKKLLWKKEIDKVYLSSSLSYNGEECALVHVFKNNIVFIKNNNILEVNEDIIDKELYGWYDNGFYIIKNKRIQIYDMSIKLIYKYDIDAEDILFSKSNNKCIYILFLNKNKLCNLLGFYINNGIITVKLYDFSCKIIPNKFMYKNIFNLIINRKRTNLILINVNYWYFVYDTDKNKQITFFIYRDAPVVYWIKFYIRIIHWDGRRISFINPKTGEIIKFPWRTIEIKNKSNNF